MNKLLSCRKRSNLAEEDTERLKSWRCWILIQLRAQKEKSRNQCLETAKWKYPEGLEGEDTDGQRRKAAHIS